MGRTLHLSHPSTTHPNYGPFILYHLNGVNAIAHLHNKELHANIHHENIQNDAPKHFNGVIIRDMGTFHRINKGLATIGHMVCDDLPNQKVNTKTKMKTLVAWS